MAALRTMSDKVQHVHGLVERFASTRDQRQAERLTQPMKRAFSRLKLDLMGAGFDTMSQLAGAMEIAAGRGGSQRNKARILREGVGSLRNQVDMEQRRILSEEKREKARADREQERADQEQERGSAEPKQDQGPAPDQD